VTLPVVPWTRRLPWIASTLYVAALAIGSGGGSEPDAWLAAALALMLAFYASRIPSGLARAVGWGLSVVVASVGAQSESRASDACGALGVFVCVAGAVVASLRMPSQGGMIPVERRSPAAWIALLLGMWWALLIAYISPDRGATAWMAGRSRAWAWLAVTVSAWALGASTEQTSRRRRLELDVAARAAATRSILLMLLVAGVVIALFNAFRADAVARCALAFGGASAAAAALYPDSVRVARVARRIVTLAVTGGGVVVLGTAAAAGRTDAWAVMLATAAVALGVGSAAAVLELPQLPGGGVWLRAFARASQEATRAEPDNAIREALLALRVPLGFDLPSPELWTFAPTRLTTVDAAGYLHERDAELPHTLALTAAEEPEGTVRTEVLEALEIRRPELRPLRAWMTGRRALFATLIAADGEIEGLLVMPAGQRADSVTLEEVVAAKGVGDRLATACRARAVASRMLARVREANARADVAEEEVLRLRHEQKVELGRHALAAARLARPATVGIYAAASRLALEALERRTSLGAPIVVVAPSGVDPVPYLARAHLSGARGQAPLVLVDATSAREQDLARWTDPRASPLALADGGMLVILDGAALPTDVQQLIARACAERRVPWERVQRLDLQLALTRVGGPGGLGYEGRLDAGLAARLGEAYEAPIVLPRLRDRPEDFRAILTDRLAREGLRVLGRPVGIEPAAYAYLADHEFPGDDVELDAVVQCLVSSCEHDTVRAADLGRLGPFGRNLHSGLRAAPKKDPLSA
jgi:hypothetical protein